MNIHVTDIGDAHIVPAATAHDFAWLELRARAAYLKRRVAIATVKMEHGLLAAEEQDELLLAGAELAAEIELWKAYR